MWSINTKPFKGYHYAAFPEELVKTPILVCTPEGGVVLDPFMGSGTTAAAAVKLGRCFTGCEINEEYVLLAMKRIAMAQNDSRIQGYCNGVFLERNFRSAD